MKLRTILWIVILVFFLAGGLISSQLMERACTPISNLLNQAAENTDPKLAQQAKKMWDKCQHGIATLADHTPMDEVESLFSQAMNYAKNGNTQEFSAICSRLASLVDAIYEAQKIYWWNII